VRLLDTCVGLQLLDRDYEGYRNMPVASTYLCKSSPHRLTGYIGYSNDVMWKLWGNLEDAVRDGTHRWKQTFGWDGPIFSHFFRTEEAKREFLMGMHGYGLISSPQVVTAFDLSKYRYLVDLGGATGHLAIAACWQRSQFLLPT
jgi:acetylserotonin N-methyltransferase